MCASKEWHCGKEKERRRTLPASENEIRKTLLSPVSPTVHRCGPWPGIRTWNLPRSTTSAVSRA